MQPTVSSTDINEASTGIVPVPGTILLNGTLRIPMDIGRDLERFRDWMHSEGISQSGQVCYFGGEVEIDMSPENILSHNQVRAALTAELFHWVRKHGLGQVFPDRALFVNENAQLSCEPDLTFCSWDGLKSGKVWLGKHVEDSEDYVEIVGSPDLVVEVVSISSVSKDTKKLPPLYFLAGVQEYWLIDARKRDISFQILRRGDSDWEYVQQDADGYLPSLVLRGAFRLVREVNPVGLDDYTLLTK